MSDLSDLPQTRTGERGTTESGVQAAIPSPALAAPTRRISANKYQTCPCGVRCYDGEEMYAEWCYVEACPCTPNRWPTDWMTQRHGIDLKALNRPGWEPGPRKLVVKEAA